MAWTRSHVGADGRRHWYVTWKNPNAGRKGEPAHLSRALGPVTEADARAEAVVIAEAEEGRPAPREGVTAADALKRFLAHAKTVRGWREKTCTFYEQKLEPCLTYLAARAPMRQWHPGMLADYLASRPAAAWGFHPAVSSRSHAASTPRTSATRRPVLLRGDAPRRIQSITAPGSMGIRRARAVGLVGSSPRSARSCRRRATFRPRSHSGRVLRAATREDNAVAPLPARGSVGAMGVGTEDGRKDLDLIGEITDI